LSIDEGAGLADLQILGILMRLGVRVSFVRPWVPPRGEDYASSFAKQGNNRFSWDVDDGKL
jgi:hypothetical protein